MADAGLHISSSEMGWYPRLCKYDAKKLDDLVALFVTHRTFLSRFFSVNKQSIAPGSG